MATQHNLRKYISSLFSLVNELKNDVANRVSYKIFEITVDEQKKTVLKIHVAGKQELISCYPEDIVAHDGFLEGFSKKDVRTITYFATQELHCPSLEIIEQQIESNTNETLFGLNNKKNGEILVKSASELSRNSSLIKKLAPLDAHLIGYAACSESFEREAKELKMFKSEEN